MPRVRFERLDPAQQAVILDAALREFSTDGYAEASLNRIIAAAGLSKGAISTQMARLAGSPADLEFLRARSADDFWSMLESDSIRLLIRLSELPDVAAGAMMNAMDAWYLSRRDVAHPDRRVVHDFIGMLRRALQP